MSSIKVRVFIYATLQWLKFSTVPNNLLNSQPLSICTVNLLSYCLGYALCTHILEVFEILCIITVKGAWKLACGKIKKVSDEQGKFAAKSIESHLGLLVDFW